MSTPATTKDEAKMLAVVSWIIAPISYIWKDHENVLVKAHARESFYFGVFSILVVIAATFLQILAGIVSSFIDPLFLLVQCVFSLLWFALMLLISVPRLIGMFKAFNGENWEVPYVTKYMSKYIKL